MQVLEFLAPKHDQDSLQGVYFFSQDDFVLRLEPGCRAVHSSLGEGSWLQSGARVFIHFPCKGVEFIGAAQRLRLSSLEGSTLRVMGKMYRSPTASTPGIELGEFSFVRLD